MLEHSFLAGEKPRKEIRTKRSLAVLGATGSIGQNVKDIVQRYPDTFHVMALVARMNVEQILKWLEFSSPALIVMTDPKAAERLKGMLDRKPGTPEVLGGEEVLGQVVSLPEVDTVVSAMVGASGLSPTYQALCHGKRVCLANKESLVVGGALMRQAIMNHHGVLLPVDSEHSALFQALVGERRDTIQRLWLTASGGPFLHRNLDSFATISPKEALQHPKWNMGPKISVDSATLMNKGLEIIEAHYLFDWPVNRIEVVIHPQSIVHSMVEFVDGSFKAQLSSPDMRLPILYALTYPDRLPLDIPTWEPKRYTNLEFFPPDIERFPCLSLAREAVEAGPSYPVVLNAANEIAVEAFLESQIPFTLIPETIRAALEAHIPCKIAELEDILRIDRETRDFTRKRIEKLT